MPGFNQRGPIGLGSMTGRKMGKCTGFGAKHQELPENSEESNLEQHRGRGLGLRKGPVSCGGRRQRGRHAN